MMSWGRIAAVTVVAMGLGFVGGAWFIGSGYGMNLFPPPPVTPAAMLVPQRVSPRPVAPSDAVAVPRSANFSMGSGGLEPKVERADLNPSPGGTWVVEPRPFHSGKSWHWTDSERSIGGDGSINLTTGGVRYLLVQATRKRSSPNDLRPVFFDANGKRMVTRPGSSSSTISSEGSFLMNEFHLDPVQHLALAQVAYFGIERVAPDGARRLVQAAQREARVKDLAILPAPRLGQPYPFDLVGTDGKAIRVGDFAGKAVLIIVWGPDSSSQTGLAMARRVREHDTSQDLVIISVSFSESVEKAWETARQYGADGPLVVIPNDAEVRRLWTDGAEIDSIPKFLLIDREGVLRFLPNIFDLKNNVDILFGRASQPFSAVIHPVRPTTKAKAKPAGNQ